jgi:hypothetical protein
MRIVLTGLKGRMELVNFSLIKLAYRVYCQKNFTLHSEMLNIGRLVNSPGEFINRFIPLTRLRQTIDHCSGLIRCQKIAGGSKNHFPVLCPDFALLL